MTILGISGSLRAGSFNSMLLRTAVELAPPDLKVEVGSIRGIPLYDGDVEAASGIPDSVRDLKDRIAAADGLLLVTPEYNNSIPGVFKNAIDWLSRPPADIPRIFGNRPVALMGASTSRFGTVLAQAAWLPVLRTLGARTWAGSRVLVSGANKVFDESGKLTDDAIRAQIQKFMAGFLEFIRPAPARQS